MFIYSFVCLTFISVCVCLIVFCLHCLQDAIISLAGCDKTIPGVMMPLARLNAVRYG